MVTTNVRIPYMTDGDGTVARVAATPLRRWVAERTGLAADAMHVGYDKAKNLAVVCDRSNGEILASVPVPAGVRVVYSPLLAFTGLLTDGGGAKFPESPWVVTDDPATATLLALAEQSVQVVHATLMACEERAAPSAAAA